MNTGRHDFAPAGLMVDVLTNAGHLVQGEIALLRAEAGQRAQSARTAIVLGVMAAVLAITALNLLAGAAVTALVAFGFAPHWATLLTGAALALIASLVGHRAYAALRDATSGHVRAFAQVQRDVEIIQSMVNANATT